MSNTLRKKRENLLRLLGRLAEMSARGIPIVVEGKKDVDVLHALDVKGDIISAKTSGRSFLDVLSEVERRGKREAILLMDFDRRGKEWTKRLTKHLEERRVKPNLFFWKRLQGLVGRDIKDIEGLATYMKTLKKRLE